MIGYISANQRFKYKNNYLIQKQYPLYLLLVSARLIKHIVKIKHMSIWTSKSKAYRKIQPTIRSDIKYMLIYIPNKTILEEQSSPEPIDALNNNKYIKITSIYIYI